MSFDAPAWLGLLLLPLLLVLFYMWSRATRWRHVASVRLWSELSRSAVSPRRFSLPPPDATLVIGLLLLICLALAAAGGWLFAGPSDRILVVVVDRSNSMAVADAAGGARRIEAATTAARSLLKAAANAKQRALLLVGGRTETWLAGPGEAAELLRSLDGVELLPGDPVELDLAAAAALARVGGDGRVVVFSDFSGGAFGPVASSDDPLLERVVVGGPAANVGIGELRTELFRRADGRLDAAATVVNASDEPVEVELSARLDGAVVLTEKRRLEAASRQRWRFAEPVGDAAELAVLVTPGGALGADDEARAPLPVAWRFTGDRTELAPELAAALTAIEGVGPSGTAVEVFRGKLPAELPRRWLYLPATTSVAEQPGELPLALDPVAGGPRSLRGTPPVLVAAGVIPAPLPREAQPLARIGGKPAIAVVESGESRGVWFGIPPELTDLAVRGALPLLIAELLAGVEPSAPTLTPVESASVAAGSPPRSVPIESFASGGKSPRHLRRALLWIALALVAAEALRRVLARARIAARGNTPTANGSSSLRAAEGVGR